MTGAQSYPHACFCFSNSSMFVLTTLNIVEKCPPTLTTGHWRHNPMCSNSIGRCPRWICNSCSGQSRSQTEVSRVGALGSGVDFQVNPPCCILVKMTRPSKTSNNLRLLCIVKNHILLEIALKTESKSSS